MYVAGGQRTLCKHDVPRSIWRVGSTPQNTSRIHEHKTLTTLTTTTLRTLGIIISIAVYRITVYSILSFLHVNQIDIAEVIQWSKAGSWIFLKVLSRIFPAFCSNTPTKSPLGRDTLTKILG